MVHGRSMSKWMASRSLIQKIAVWYVTLFLIHSTTKLNLNGLIWWLSCWMPIWYANQKMTAFLRTRIEFQGSLEQYFLFTRSEQNCLWWGDGFGIQICQEGRWQTKLVLGKIFTSMAAAVICKLLTKNVVVGLPLSTLWGNTLEQWVHMAQKDYLSIISEECERDPLRRLNSVPLHCLEVPTIPPLGYLAHTLALEWIPVIPLRKVAETFMTVIHNTKYGTDLKFGHSFEADNADHTHRRLKMNIDKPKYRGNSHIVLYDMLESRPKPSSNDQLLQWSWRFGICDKCHCY